jgi:hypothetical protein
MGCGKGLLVFLVMLCFFSVSASDVSADGMILHYKDSWRILGQNSQTAGINYEEGKQKMIIAVQAVDQTFEGDRAVWVFPVPGDPGQVELDVLEKLPEFGGKNVTRQAKDELMMSYVLISTSQVYSVLGLLVSFPATHMASGVSGDWRLGVDVYQQIEKFGVTMELVGADDSESFYNYVSGKGLSFPGSTRDVIDHYIGSDYSFVLYWVSDLEEFRKHLTTGPMGMFTNMGVYVSFPSDRIYYPLRPTSVYREKIIPVSLTIIGYAEPEFYDEITDSEEGWSQVSHLFQKGYVIPEELEKFFGRSGTINLVYTGVTMYRPADVFVDDLWIEPKPDEEFFSRYQLPMFISVNIQWISVLWLVVISALSSVLASLVIFWGQRPKPGFFSLLGLSNVFTLIGFAAASCRFLPEEKKAGKKGTRERLIFLLVVVAYLIFVNWFMMSMPTRMMGYLFYFTESLPVVLTYLVAPAALLFLVGYIKRPETTKFVLLFSALFLLLSYAVYSGLLGLF